MKQTFQKFLDGLMLRAFIAFAFWPEMVVVIAVSAAGALFLGSGR